MALVFFLGASVSLRAQIWELPSNSTSSAFNHDSHNIKFENPKILDNKYLNCECNLPASSRTNARASTKLIASVGELSTRQNESCATSPKGIINHALRDSRTAVERLFMQSLELVMQSHSSLLRRLIRSTATTVRAISTKASPRIRVASQYHQIPRLTGRMLFLRERIHHHTSAVAPA